MAGEVMPRAQTGISGFDQISQGGFVQNSTNVILGGPGSGKSTFLLQFLWNGVTIFNENGLYCSFEPDIIETLKDGLSFGWDFARLNEQNRVKFLKFSPETSIEELKSELTKIISAYSIRRLCIDPVSIISLTKKQDKIRQALFDLTSLTKRLNTTTLLADELIEPETPKRNLQPNKADAINFLADSITILYESNPQKKSPKDKKKNKPIPTRSIRISKMRRTNHLRKLAGMEITNQGIEIYSDSPNLPQLPPQPIQPPTQPMQQIPPQPLQPPQLPPPQPPAQE